MKEMKQRQQTVGTQKTTVRSGLDLYSPMFPIIVLAVLNLFTHFLPFERAALAPDDYANLLKVQNMPLSEIIITALSNPDRPLNYLTVFLQEKLVGLNPEMGLLLVCLSSMLLITAIYCLFLKLFNDTFLALFGALFYLLLPNKLDLYHTPIYVNINLVFALYIFSFISFVRFIVGKRGPLLLSIVSYGLAIFWYEVGFFLPVVLFAYAMMYNEHRQKAALYFLIPAFVYILFRITGVFGLYDTTSFRSVNSLPGVVYNMFVMIPNHYIGRYMVRAILYGIYKFPSMEFPWIVVVTLIDVVALYIFIVWMKKRETPAIDVKLFYIAGIMFISFLIPNILYTVESRHTTLSSIGFVILCIALLQYSQHWWKAVSSAIFVLCLIVSQGAAWSQVIACRINNAVFESISEQKAHIVKSDRVLIDTRSFADRIPYTWGERQGNMLNAYYGMQAFAPWGLTAMVKLIADGRKPVYIGRSRPEESDNQLTFQIQVDGPFHRIETIPKRGTVVINYESVYGGGFRNGNRVKKTHKQE